MICCAENEWGQPCQKYTEVTCPECLEPWCGEHVAGHICFKAAHAGDTISSLVDKFYGAEEKL